MNPATVIGGFFWSIKDPRTGPAVRHKLLDILVIAILATISGADSWVGVAAYGQAKKTWLKTLLELPSGIPSHDTFGRVFAMIDPDAFTRHFADWTQAMAAMAKGQVIAIDGKSVRRSHDRGRQQPPLHVVSAWASENRLVVGQVAVETKSNEITAIPQLLTLLQLEGTTVTIDAMGCQREIARQIRDQGAEYVLMLKGNQPNLLQRAETLFSPIRQGLEPDLAVDFYEQTEKGHGRLETRRCWSMAIPHWRFYLDPDEQWQGLETIVMVQRTRQVTGSDKTVEHHYYIASLPSDAKQLLNAVRTHWSIENSLHWVLDIAFREDQNRVRADNGQLMLCCLRHLALNLLQQDKSARTGIRARRLRAGWDNDYLISLFSLPSNA